MAQSTVTIGQAIDQVLTALESFDEKGKKTILSTVCAHMGVDLGGGSPGFSPLPHAVDPIAPSNSDVHHVKPAAHTDIRSLKDRKQPKSAIQMACIVAYYLNEHAAGDDKKSTVKVEDMEKYFKQGQYKLPTKLNQLLVDAKAAGYFDSVGRGEYKLNAVGYNLVAHTLPTSQTVK